MFKNDEEWTKVFKRTFQQGGSPRLSKFDRRCKGKEKLNPKNCLVTEHQGGAKARIVVEEATGGEGKGDVREGDGGENGGRAYEDSTTGEGTASAEEAFVPAT